MGSLLRFGRRCPTVPFSWDSKETQENCAVFLARSRLLNFTLETSAKLVTSTYFPNIFESNWSN